jgi:hypothetical protein
MTQHGIITPREESEQWKNWKTEAAYRSLFLAEILQLVANSQEPKPRLMSAEEKRLLGIAEDFLARSQD